ncbi:GntR family transcriptional regulator [uncultured Microbacterium sp.]|uniref:GntR family transcriptional regulator n=1 Tax=uncultured Microbacterium sp. TaxID=191216 RepID=UPI0025F4ADDE|nr:GntR family transcriptional regulator [uncultured Microbacterium sp.]
MKQLLAETIFQRIGASIVDGTLPSGSRIRDADLAEEFNVSRMPIREALQRLERIGLVEMHPSRFTEVTEVSPEDTANARQYAGYVGGAIAAIAVPRLREETRLQLVDHVRALDGLLDDSARLAESRWGVIRALATKSGNDVFQTMLDETSLLIVRNLRPWVLSGYEQDRMRALHADLAAAMLDGDGHAAERAVRGIHGVQNI